VIDEIRITQISSSRLVFLILAITLLTSTKLVSADTQSSKSSVDYLVKVTNPQGTPEVYNTPTGLAQWHQGLPIPEQDSIDVVPTVSTGADALKGVSVKLDGKQLPSNTALTVHVPGNVLTIGDHELDIAVKLTKRYDTANLVLKLSVVSSLPADLVPPSAPVISSVKGAQQVLSAGKVAFVDPTGETIVPPLVGSMAKQVGTPGVAVAFADANAQTQLQTNQTVDVVGELDATVAAEAESPDTSFVFSIVRDGSVVYSCSKQLTIAGSDIHLVAHTDDTPGLYPGIVALYVWGIDGSGNYSSPTIVNLSIKDESASTITKS